MTTRTPNPNRTAAAAAFAAAWNTYLQGGRSPYWYIMRPDFDNPGGPDQPQAQFTSAAEAAAALAGEEWLGTLAYVISADNEAARRLYEQTYFLN